VPEIPNLVLVGIACLTWTDLCKNMPFEQKPIIIVVLVVVTAQLYMHGSVGRLYDRHLAPAPAVFKAFRLQNFGRLSLIKQ